VTPQTIYRWLREGGLDQYPAEGGVVLLTAESVERLKAEREAKG